MPELYRSVIGSIVRFALTGLFGWLAAKGVITEGQAGELVIAIAGGVVVLGWSIFQKYRGRLKFITALELPENASEKKVEAVIAATSAGGNVSKALE